MLFVVGLSTAIRFPASVFSAALKGYLRHDLVSVVGAPPNWGLVFKNQENEIFLIEFRGAKLPNKVKKIVRKYD